MAKLLEAEDRDEQVCRSTRVSRCAGIERRNGSQIDGRNQVSRAHADSDTVGGGDLRRQRSSGQRNEAWRLRGTAARFEGHLATVVVHGRAARLLRRRHLDSKEARRRRENNHRDCHRCRQKSPTRSHASNHCLRVHLHPQDSNSQFRAHPGGSHGQPDEVALATRLNT